MFEKIGIMTLKKTWYYTNCGKVFFMKRFLKKDFPLISYNPLHCFPTLHLGIMIWTNLKLPYMGYLGMLPHRYNFPGQMKFEKIFKNITLFVPKFAPPPPIVAQPYPREDHDLKKIWTYTTWRCFHIGTNFSGQIVFE